MHALCAECTTWLGSSVALGQRQPSMGRAHGWLYKDLKRIPSGTIRYKQSLVGVGTRRGVAPQAMRTGWVVVHPHCLLELKRHTPHSVQRAELLGYFSTLPDPPQGRTSKAQHHDATTHPQACQILHYLQTLLYVASMLISFSYTEYLLSHPIPYYQLLYTNLSTHRSIPLFS